LKNGPESITRRIPYWDSKFYELDFRMKVIRTHPKGMYLLGVTATLHNFAFLGVVTLFPFFMTRAFDLTEGEATQAYGAFFGVALVLPLVGGQFPKTRFPERPLLAVSGRSLIRDFFGI
jgi:hypothetical protein